MSLTSSLYLIEVVSNIDCVLCISFICMLIALAFCFSCFVNSDDKEEYVKFAKFINKLFFPLLMVGFIILFIPSKQSMYMMLGSKYLSDSTIPAKVQQALSLKIDGYIDELQGKKHE